MGGQQSFCHQENDGQSYRHDALYEINEKDKSATIGYTWYIPSVWGKVYNKECKLLLLQYIFEELQFKRAELRVAHQNIRSQKAVEKIGGVKEGVLRKHGYRNDGSLKAHRYLSASLMMNGLAVKENLLQLIAESEND